MLFTFLLFGLQGTILCHAKSSMGKFLPSEIQNQLGTNTPYFSVKDYKDPPDHCAINQVNIIQRHGARFPTSGASKKFQATLAKLQTAKKLDSKLDFIPKFNYSLGVADLVPFGALQSSEAGQVTFKRYSKLISKSQLPFIRASSGPRVVDSAGNWTAAFSVASKLKPVVSVIINEDLNDPLDDNMCPNAGNSDPQTDEFTAIFGTPIAARLNTLATGANLTAGDITNLMDLCGFETVAKQVPSPFCNLFSAAEFAQYEYLVDLDKFYGTGYGQALGPVQGVGYVNELLARLTGTPVQDKTQTNSTLDASATTFPLDRNMYADFSHDNQMIAIMSALGLFKQAVPLDPKKPDPKRTWIASHMTSFSARIVTERLSCKASSSKGSAFAVPQTFVRILVNDALQPLEFCGGDKHGLCTLDAFVKSQSFARTNGNGNFAKCTS